MAKEYISRILQYDVANNMVGEYTGSLLSIVQNIAYPDKYYYRFTCFKDDGGIKRERYSHFGLNGINKGGHYYSMPELVNRSLNHDIQIYCKRKREGKKGYYLSFENQLFACTMQLQANSFLELNKANEFNMHFDDFIKRHKEFDEVDDLKKYLCMTGIYLLVLDRYNVCYFGQTQSSIARRIKEHWTRSNYFQRGIDRFKALDTTRIFAYPLHDVNEINNAECRYIAEFPAQYTLNSASGGDVFYQNNHEPLQNRMPFFVRERATWEKYYEEAKEILAITCTKT